MTRIGIALACLVALAAATAAACCLGTPDGNLPEPVSFRAEAIHTGGAPDEAVFLYYPDSAEPAPYFATFEIRQGGRVAVAVAGRVYEEISADRPIKLPAVPAEPGVTVVAKTDIIDRYGRTVHSSETALTPGLVQTTG
ncbi:MAG: hypothetical protein PHP59_04320 [Methanofollis sp.]|uniref:hypothetical protein n=1 Tax=Methanofollis sp. TaxID=2052835 RepID=UPI0026324E97|nr:hypothetical protein [Methanofollis sp.]MDD4254584.1 hypothetical protein [Methanofollis sp.]